MKTVSVALVLCLNVGVDPPDIVKTQPCARLECWIGSFIYISSAPRIPGESTARYYVIVTFEVMRVHGPDVATDRVRFLRTRDFRESPPGVGLKPSSFELVI